MTERKGESICSLIWGADNTINFFTDRLLDYDNFGFTYTVKQGNEEHIIT